MELVKVIDSYITLDEETLALEEQKNKLLQATEVFKQIQALDIKAQELQEQKELVREQLTTAMREHGHMVFENEIIRIKYTPPTTRKGVNTDVLKATYPDVYKAVLKETDVKDKVTITYRNKEEV